jgi:1-phosphatidylinositol-4-phosphate 5-kinase
MKDNDLTYKFEIGRQYKLVLITILKQDVKFLQSEGLMDYSLIVGVHHSSDRAARRGTVVDSGMLAMDCCPGLPHEYFCSKFQEVCGGIRQRKEELGRGYSSAKAMGGVYFIGIVDILQKYSGKKFFETAFRSATAKTRDISAVPPDFYGERFLEYMENKVFE